MITESLRALSTRTSMSHCPIRGGPVGKCRGEDQQRRRRRARSLVGPPGHRPERVHGLRAFAEVHTTAGLTRSG